LDGERVSGYEVANIDLDTEFLGNLSLERLRMGLPGLYLAAGKLPFAIQVGAGPLRQQDQAITFDQGSDHIFHRYHRLRLSTVKAR
jgi:hypothetical protein